MIRRRLHCFVAASGYFVAYTTAYVLFVVQIFDSWGLGLREDLSVADVVTLWLLAAAPALLYPSRRRRPSDFLIAIQYLIVYVPTLWVALNASRPQLAREDAWALIFTLFAAMVLQMALRQVLPVSAPGLPRLPGRVYLGALLGATAASLGYLMMRLGGQFDLVSLDAIYDLRYAASEALAESQSALGAYLLNWVSAVYLPLLAAVGLYTGQRVLVLVASAGYVVLYGLWGSKAFLLAPLVIVAVHFLVRRSPEAALVPLVKACAVLLLLPVAFFWIDEAWSEFVIGWYVHLVHQRTFSSSALAIPQYLDFFATNPYTYGSHIAGIRSLVPYPFELDVPRSVGLHHYGGLMTANVNYWAQDGISGFGLAGVPVVAVLAALVYWVLDCAAAHLDHRLATVAVSFIAMNLADTSLFTSLLTGGLGLMILAFLIMPARLVPAGPLAPVAAPARFLELRPQAT